MRNRLILLLVLLTTLGHAQTMNELVSQTPRDFTARQWKPFQRAWLNQGPWVILETHGGETLRGQILYDERGDGFHFWTSTDFFDPSRWDEHYRYLPYTEVLRINDMFAYPQGDLAKYLAGGLVAGGAIGAPFFGAPLGAGISTTFALSTYLTLQFLNYNGSPRLMYLRRQVGGTYYKDYRLKERQLFANGLPDTTQLPYMSLAEWVPESTTLSNVFFSPSFGAYAGAGISFLPQAPVSAAPFIETVVGIEGELPNTPIWLVGEVASVSAVTAPAGNEPLLRYFDASAMVAYPFVTFDRFGVQRFRLALQAGVLYRGLQYEFGTVNGSIQELYNLTGGRVGLKASYRMAHRFSFWGQASANILSPISLPWPTPEFDPNILRSTPISTTSIHLQGGFSWHF